MDRFVIKKKRVVEEDEEGGDKSKKGSEGGTAEPKHEAAPEQSIAASCSTGPTCTAADTGTAPSDLSQSPVDEPRWPLLRRYPATKVGHQDRYFNRRWYEDYKWLEYSISKDCVFCFACRHFQRMKPTF